MKLLSKLRGLQNITERSLVVGLLFLTMTGLIALSPVKDRAVWIGTISYGDGVPDGAFKAFTKARKEMEQLQAGNKVLRLIQGYGGPEGEQELCAEFVSTDLAMSFYTKVNAKNVDRFKVWTARVCPPKDAEPDY